MLAKLIERMDLGPELFGLVAGEASVQPHSLGGLGGVVGGQAARLGPPEGVAQSRERLEQLRQARLPRHEASLLAVCPAWRGVTGLVTGRTPGRRRRVRASPRLRRMRPRPAPLWRQSVDPRCRASATQLRLGCRFEHLAANAPERLDRGVTTAAE
jgi:hypothetical protein